MVSAPTPYLTKVFDILVPYIFPLIGLACIFEPYIMTDYAPVLIGTVMVLGGAYSHLEAIRHKTYKQLENIDMANSLMLLIVGVLILIKRDHAIELMGYAWGLLGLSKGARLFDQAISRKFQHEPMWLRLFWAVVNMALGILLIFDPSENFSHHVFLLGFELIAYSAQHLNLWQWASHRYAWLRNQLGKS